MPAGPSLIDTLSARERDVLRFLPSRLTVREIAAELYISVNTLKFHMRAIYRKLGVNTRAEAVEVAANDDQGPQVGRRSLFEQRGRGRVVCRPTPNRVGARPATRRAMD